VEKTRIPGENHIPATSHWQTLSHNVVSSTPCLNRILTHNVSDTNRLVNLSLLICTNLNKMKSSLLKITTLEVYKKLYSAYFFHCYMSVVFSRDSAFLHQWNWLPRYNGNIFESGIKHHNHNHISAISIV
jgi:hypothetical protein